jgi:HEAT repeat protein
VWAFYLLGYVNFKEEPSDLLFQALDPQLERSDVIRGYAAQAICRLQPQESRQKLWEALVGETDLKVVRKIVWALSQVGTPVTIPILENYLRTGQVPARTSVQRSIAEIRRRYAMSG